MRRKRSEDGLREEIDFYLDLRTDELVKEGLDPEAARAAAEAAFGDRARIEGEALDLIEPPSPWAHRMAALCHDLRHGFRGLKRRPGFSIIVVLTLGLGVGLNAAVFSLVHGIMINPLPFPDSDRLMEVREATADRPDRSLSPATFLDVQRDGEAFSGVAAYRVVGRNLLGEGEPERVVVGTVSASFFRTLEVSARLGRTFDEPVVPGDTRPTVLSHGLWERRFGADPNVIGRTLQLDNESLLIVGVMGPAFAFPTDAVLWAPAFYDVPELAASGIMDHRAIRDAWYFNAVARLAPGVDVDRAQRVLDRVAADVRETDPAQNADTRLLAVPLLERTVAGAGRPLILLLASVIVVLAIACANVANLVGARITSHGHELDVRTALGATRRRIVLHLGAELAVLAGCGAAVGIVLASVSLGLVRDLASAVLPRIEEVRISPAVVLFALAAALATMGIAAWGSALLGRRRRKAGSTLVRSARSLPTRRWKGTLIAGECGLSVALVIVSGLAIKSLWNINQVDLGFDVAALATLPFMLPGAADMERESWVREYREIEAQVARLPSTRAVGLASRGPVSTGLLAGLRIEGKAVAEDALMDAGWQVATEGYFRAVGLPLLAGRLFDDSDRAETEPVAVINETLARVGWPGESPIGRRLNTGLDGDGVWVRVIGVVGDARNRGPLRSVVPAYFRPLTQPSRPPGTGMMLVVRAAGEVGTAVAETQRAAWSVRDDLPFYRILTESEIAAGFSAQNRFLLTLLTAFAVLAMLLGALGIYGVTAFVLAQRTRELGIRRAVGSSPGGIVALVMRETMSFAAIGVGVGLLATTAARPLLAAVLFQVRPGDPTVLLTVTALVLTTAAAAALIPARRASRNDPVRAIQND